MAVYSDEVLHFLAEKLYPEDLRPIGIQVLALDEAKIKAIEFNDRGDITNQLYQMLKSGLEKPSDSEWYTREEILNDFLVFRRRHIYHQCMEFLKERKPCPNLRKREEKKNIHQSPDQLAGTNHSVYNNSNNDYSNSNYYNKINNYYYYSYHYHPQMPQPMVMVNNWISPSWTYHNRSMFSPQCNHTTRSTGMLNIINGMTNVSISL
ncbi:uncharacterized protein LOC121406208 [Lytechinus variegatus]|uniref:uncharacterized protein LOC121406208 n=1 Tax=Lytechinus variegatus TaxID=7654 RepID=UPI001BB10C69|nr:uncharacterized protein LOC121406208 [Lytechinus variegatus]